MVEAAQRAKSRIDDVAALGARYVNDEPDAARVVLEAGVVEAAGGRQGAERQATGGAREVPPEARRGAAATPAARPTRC